LTDSQNDSPARSVLRLVGEIFLPSVAVGLLLGTFASCRKGERAAPAAASTEAAGPAPTKVEKPIEKDVPFSISETPKTGETPFSGLKEPQQAAFDGKGRLWIIDSANSRVAVFDSAGGFLGGFGGPGSGHFGLRNPEGIAIRGENLYVADTWNGRVIAYTLSGDYKGEVHGLYGPRGVAVGANGRVFATDSGNGRVLSYDAALGDETVIGTKGNGKGEFNGPIGIAVSPSGRVYVADMGNHRIQVLDAAGKPLTSLKYPGREQTWNVYPEIDSNETVYVPDPDAAEVFALNRSGAVQKKWNAGDDGQKFVRPCCLTLDRKQSTLYVINAGSNSVSKLKLR
jgi:DNA-binding beta-propeller fold protein YncE